MMDKDSKEQHDKTSFHGHWLAIVLIICFGLWSWHVAHMRTQLRVGSFVGSPWNVPSSDGYAVMDAAIRSFEAEHPYVDVTYVSGIKPDDYQEWLAEQILAGTEPDVFLVPDEDFEAYADMGVFQNLEDISLRDKGFDEAGFYPVAMEYGRKDGTLYALPVECVPTLMFVNKTLLEREGIPMPSQDWNWQDFYEICAKVTKDTDGDGVLDQFGMYEYNWQLAVATNGGGLFSPEGKSCYFADGRVEQSVNFVMRLKKLQQGHEVTSREVDLGRVAFRPFTFAQYKTYKPYPWRIKKFSDSEWDCVRLPAGPAGENVSPVRTLLIAMSNRTAEPGLAWQFIKKISMDSEVQMLLMEKSQGLSVRRDVVLKAAWNERGRADSESIDLQAVSQVMEGAINPPKFRDYKAAIILAENAIQDIYAGKVPLSNGLHKLQKEVNAYLQR